MTAFTLTSGGVTLAVSPCWRITRGRRISATHRISARRCSSLRFRKTIMIWRQRRGPPAMCGIAGACCQQRLASVHRLPGADRFPFYDSVFGDTANAGTELGENPIRANVRGSHCFPRELAPPKIGSIPRHLPRLPLIRSGMRDAIQFIGRARKRWIWRWSATLV
jgi:hypothetical protein